MLPAALAERASSVRIITKAVQPTVHNAPRFHFGCELPRAYERDPNVRGTTLQRKQHTPLQIIQPWTENGKHESAADFNSPPSLAQVVPYVQWIVYSTLGDSTVAVTAFLL